jgi:nitrite reductase (NAD(P)H)
VVEIIPDQKAVLTSAGDSVPYDILVLATGSDATLPTHTPGYNAKGVFVYRTIGDLERLMEFASRHKGTVGATVGGGLLGLEAANAMMDLKSFGSVKIIDRNKWVLARQLDADAGALVTAKIRELGLDVMLRKQVAIIKTDHDDNVIGIVFEDGDIIDCSCVCFAVRIIPFPFNCFPSRTKFQYRSAYERGMSWVRRLASNVQSEVDLLLMQG